MLPEGIYCIIPFTLPVDSVMKRYAVVITCILTLCALALSPAIERASADSGWSNPVLLEYESGNAGQLSLAVSGTGTVFAAWPQAEDGDSNIWTNTYIPGYGWGGPECISLKGWGTADYPSVAASESGNAVAVWTYFDAGYIDIYANVYSPGVGWGAPENIESVDGDCEEPCVAIDDAGNAIAIWHHDDVPTYSPMACRFVLGEGWGEPELIESQEYAAMRAKIAMSGSGDAIAVWGQFDGTDTDLWASHYAVGVGWDTPVMIESIDTSSPAFVKLAMDDLGNAVAVWVQIDEGHQSIYCNRYSADSGWGSAELLETYSDGTATYPAVACSGTGDAIAVWYMYEGTRTDIWANRYIPGSGWSGPTLVETSDLGNANNPLIAADSMGTYTAVWRQSDGDFFNVIASQYRPGTGWGSPETIEMIPGSVWQHVVAMNDEGDTAAIFSLTDSNRVNVYGSVYSPPDVSPPVITVTSPSSGLTVSVPTVVVSGTTEPGAELFVNGMLTLVDPVTGAFSATVSLEVGENVIDLVAYDVSGNSGTSSVTVEYVDPVPDLEDALEALLVELSELVNESELTETELASLLEQIEALNARLNETRSELNNTLDQLDDTENQLDIVEEDMNKLPTMAAVLGGVLAVAVLALIAISMAYLGLRKGARKPAITPEDREPPPPDAQ